MADEINPTQESSSVEGQDTEAVNSGEGAATSDSGKQTDQRKFTQDELNRTVTARLAEEKARLQKKFEKELAEKLAAKDGDLEKLVEERLAASLKARELDAARAEVAREFGLNEKQSAVLTGETPEEVRASAEELFAPLRKTPPVVPTGGNGGSDTAPGVFTRAQLRDPAFYSKHKDEILRAAAEGRIVDE